MDDGSLVNESGDEMEVSPNNSDHDIQDKSEESREGLATLGNPVLPSVRRDASEIHASSPPALNVDQHDATLSSTDCQQNLLTEEKEANIHSSITSKASSAGLSQDSMAKKESSPDLDSSSVLPDAPECVPGSSKTAGLPTDKALGLNIDPTSNPQHYATEGYEPTTKMETDETSSGKSENTQLTSNIAHPGIEMQMPESSQSSSIIGNPYLPLESGSSTINNSDRELEFKARDSKNEETSRNPKDSLTPMSKPIVKPRPELGETNKYSNRGMVATSLLTYLKQKNLFKRPNSEEPTQEKRSDPMLKKPHTGSISTSSQRSDVGVDANPPQDVYETGDSSCDQTTTPRNQPEGSSDLNHPHKEHLSTSSHQPVITKCTSSNQFNPSGDTPDRVTNTMTTERNASSEGVSKYTFMAQNLLLTVLGEIMKTTDKVDEFGKFREHFAEIHECPCDVTEKCLQGDLATYLGHRKAVFLGEKGPSSDDSLEYRVKKTMETLTRIVVTALIYTVSVWSSMKLDEIMINYTTFKSLYENCYGVWTHEKIKMQDEESKNLEEYSKKIKEIERLLLQTRTAFQLLLMHIGEYADQRFIDTNIKLLFKDHEKYLRRRIVQFKEGSSKNPS